MFRKYYNLVNDMQKRSKPKVLLIDDDENLLSSIVRLLRSFYDITTATCADEALAILQDASFPVIISDYKMPGMDGLTLLEKIKASYPQSVLVLLTGYADVTLAINALNKGVCYKFLQKPCSAQDIGEAINGCIDKYTIDLSKIRESNEDTITGLYRKSVITEKLDYEIARSQRYKCVFSIALIKVSNYEELCRNYDKYVADQVLREIATTFRKGVRRVDYLGRYDSEQFLFIMPETDGVKSKITAKKLLDTVKSLNFKEYPDLTIKVAIGITQFCNDSVEEILSRASKALEQASEAAKKHIVLL